MGFFMFKKNIAIRVFLLITLLFTTKSIFPVTYYVTTDGDDLSSGTSWDVSLNTLSRAMELAEPGDEIWVKKGTYKDCHPLEIPEGYSVYGGFEGTETELSQRDIQNNPTILDRLYNHHLVNLGFISGFQIYRAISREPGGGIYNKKGTVSHCMVYNNYSEYDGGGIYNEEGNVLHCEVFNNHSVTAYNTPPNNRGGGIFSEKGTISCCRIYNNYSYEEGGGVYLDSAEMLNCIVYNNFSSGLGKGVYCKYSILINCTIYGNQGLGMGELCNYRGNRVQNCIIWNNENEDIFGELSKVTFSCFGEAGFSNGNLRIDPCFVNVSDDPTSWDFHLQNGSPCIDAGSLLDAPEIDLEGTPRPGGDGKVCMGAFESPDEFTPPTPFPPVRFYVSKQGSDTSGTSWEDAFTSISTAISSFSGDELTEVWVAEGIYIEAESVYIPEGMILYGGFTGGESLLDERDFKNHPTIIHGENKYSCVNNSGFLDGFHIRNGKTDDRWGGVWNEGFIGNCYIYNNYAEKEAGGVYNKGILTNSEIFENTSNSCGGIRNLGIVDNCSVYKNSARYCGGICNNGGGIFNCLIYDNTAEETAGGISNDGKGFIWNCSVFQNAAHHGGGVYNTSGYVKNCLIHNNQAETGAGIFIFGEKSLVLNSSIYENNAVTMGGGIRCGYCGIIRDCLVYNNSSQDGGGIYNEGSSVENTVIQGNTALNNGGGFYIDYGGIQNCLIYNNTSNMGGGIYHYGGVIIYATVYGNNALEAGGGIYHERCYEAIYNSIIWNNSGGDFIGENSDIHYSCFGEANYSDENIRANPLFVNTSGDPETWDFHLRDGSPCVDIGNSDERIYPYPPETDIEGTPRPGDDDAVCMGAYESPDHYLPSEPLAPIQLYIDKNGSNTTGLSWEDAFTSITTALAFTRDDNLYELWISGGNFFEEQELFIKPAVRCFGGFSGTENSTDERSPDAAPSIIDGGGIFRCMTNNGYVENLRFTNGWAEDKGGGIKNTGTIENCHFHGNTSLAEGGGIYNNHGIIKNCSIYNNSAETGGGIDSIQGDVSHCSIYNNNAKNGGGIHAYDGIFANSAVHSNKADFGGGILMESFCEVNHCTIYNNEALSGGGIYNDLGKISNCLIFLNSAPEGGGVYGKNAEIKNSTIYGNIADTGGGVCGSPSIRNCIIWKNETDDISITNMNFVKDTCFGGAPDVNGNIDLDPRFINPEPDISGWDFHLADDSPCIDAGNPEKVYNDGFLPPGKGTTRCDMGAYGGPKNYAWEPFCFQSALALLTGYGDLWKALNQGMAPFENPFCLGYLEFDFSPMQGWRPLKSNADGMGVKDIVQINPYGDIWVCINKGMAMEPPAFWGKTGFMYDEKNGYNGWYPLSGDVDADGDDDLIQVTEYGDAWVCRSYAAYTKYLSSNRWGWLGYEFSRANSGEHGAIPLAGDVNADGLCDLIQITRYGDAWVALSQSYKFSTPERWAWLGFHYSPYDGWYPLCGDMNGDGRDDLIQVTPFGDAWVALSIENSFTEPERWGWLGFFYDEERGWYPLLGDVNADGMEDLIQITEYGDAWVALSLGNGFAQPERWGTPGFLFSRENGNLPFFLDY